MNSVTKVPQAATNVMLELFVGVTQETGAALGSGKTDSLDSLSSQSSPPSTSKVKTASASKSAFKAVGSDHPLKSRPLIQHKKTLSFEWSEDLKQWIQSVNAGQPALTFPTDELVDGGHRGAPAEDCARKFGTSDDV